MIFSGIYLFMTDPASTPRRDDKTSAVAEPRNVSQMDLDFEAKSIVDNCVLSPSSAKNTSKNAENILLNIKFTYLIKFQKYSNEIIKIKKLNNIKNIN